MSSDITIPADLLPSDGRFGSGPSKVRPEAVAALAEHAVDYMGTSHRRPTVQFVVAELRNSIAELLNAPDGYEILLGNGPARLENGYLNLLATGVLLTDARIADEG